MPKVTLDSPMRDWRGVGSERAAQLARLNLVLGADLLLHRPRRYEDRRHTLRIADLQVGGAATVRGRVVAKGVKWFRRRAKSVFELILDDGSARLHCRWWNLPFMDQYFQLGDDVFAFGKTAALKPRGFDHPETEVVVADEDSSIHINRVTPVYPLTEGLPQRWLRSLLWRAVSELAPGLPDPHAMLDLDVGDLPTRSEALQWIHFPETLEQAELGRQRLAFDEFFELQLALRRRRITLNTRARALPCGGTNALMKPFLAGLEFQLTPAQTRVLRDIRKDLSGPHPMRRLVQGDVGSGKTAVAACAALMTIEGGYNVALMAPTEILAEQHHRTFRRWFQPLGIEVALRTGHRKDGLPTPGMAPSPPSAGRRSAAPDTPPAKPPGCLVIGTHALIEDAFRQPNLGLVLIDEQHKFGVVQREQLVRKGNYPHLLVMTATPIPRTLGLTLYGDLDVSVIDELPGGRGALKTFVRTPGALNKVHDFIRKQLDQGRQAYVVCPRIEESEPARQLKAVRQEYETLRTRFAPHEVGLLHGRLAPEEKERVMAAFRAGALPVLLATTVIEVGLDVPNATVMLIENADGFGLAQLHQLRGRIGRGGHDAYCILVASRETKEARQRLAVLEKTNDGFRIAEEDLALRGPGELLGKDQSGVPPFKFGELTRDGSLIERARALAARTLEG